MIAPLLDDIETDVGYYFGEDVYIHQPSSDSICIRWCGEDYWSAQTNVGGNPVNIELILYSNGNIQFNYGEGNIGMSPDIGISAGDGVNYVISAHNGSNNLNNAQSCRFIFLKPEDAYNASDELYISFNVSETLASDPTVEIDSISATKLSGAGNAYKYNYDITGSETEGTLPVTITGYDFANNQGTDTSQNVTFDFTAPSFQTVTVTDPDIYYKPGDTLTIQATMTETGLTLMADLSVLDSALAPVAQLTDNGDNTYTLTTGTLTEATMVEGTGITVEINARDAAGNETASNDLTVILDKTPPTKPSIVVKGGFITNSQNVEFTLSAADAAEMILSEDSNFTGATWETYSTAKTFALSAGDGYKTVYAKFRDIAGNETSLVNTDDAVSLVTDAGNIKIYQLSSDLTSIISESTVSLNNPRSGVLDPSDGSILVADRDNHRIVRLSADMTSITNESGGQMSDPYSLSANSNDGTCWVADRANNQVYLVAANKGGEIKRINGFTAPCSVSVNTGDGSCWVTEEADPGRVIKLHPGIVDGYDIATDTGSHTTVTGFNKPLSVCVNSTDNTCWVTDSWNNQVVKLSATGSELVRISGFTQPRSVAVKSDGTCWVADSPNNRVVKLDYDIANGYDISTNTGSHLAVIGFNYPVAAAVHTDGTCWVADKNADRIVRIASGVADGYDLTVNTGSHVICSGFNEPFSVSVNTTDGTCWAGDKDNNQAVKLSADGSTELARIGGFGVSYSVSVDSSNGTCWVGDGDGDKVVEIIGDGSQVLSIDGRFSFPESLSLNSADGTIWVADNYNDNVAKLASDLTVIKRVGGFDNPHSVAVNTTDGSCWVSDHYNGQVVKLSAAGTELLRLDGFSLPERVSVNPANGHCWVADRGNNQVVRLDSAGVELARVSGFLGSIYSLCVNVTDGSCWVGSTYYGKTVKLEPDVPDGYNVYSDTGYHVRVSDLSDIRNVTVNPDNGECFAASAGKVMRALAHGEAMDVSETIFGVIQYISNYTRRIDLDSTLGSGAVSVTVTKDGQPMSGKTVYACNAYGEYLRKSADTDANGQVTFSDLVDYETYKFKIDSYYGYIFWSSAVSVGSNTTIDIAFTQRTVTVKADTTPLDGQEVSVYADDEAIGMSGNTNASGDVSFSLPANISYKFHTRYLENDFWSAETTQDTVTMTIDVFDVEITASVADTPLAGYTIYPYTVDGEDTEIQAITDSSGKATFSMPYGYTYRYKTYYNSKEYWSHSYSSNPSIKLTVFDLVQPANGISVYGPIDFIVSIPQFVQWWGLRWGAGTDPTDWYTAADQTGTPSSWRLMWANPPLTSGTYTVKLAVKYPPHYDRFSDLTVIQITVDPNLAIAGITIENQPFHPQDGENADSVYSLPFSGSVTADVLDAFDNDILVKRIADSVSQASGENSVTWNGKKTDGSWAVPAVYRARIQADYVSGNLACFLSQKFTRINQQLEAKLVLPSPFSYSDTMSRDGYPMLLSVNQPALIHLFIYPEEGWYSEDYCTRIVHLYRPAGEHLYVWDGKDRLNNDVEAFPDCTVEMKTWSLTDDTFIVRDEYGWEGGE